MNRRAAMTNRGLQPFLIAMPTFYMFGIAEVPHASKATRRPNVLYIVAHDITANFQSYGSNLRTIAQNGVQFEFAFTNSPFCNPSRNSFLVGRRPVTTGLHTFKDPHREAPVRTWASLPGMFEAAGYRTMSIGQTAGWWLKNTWSFLLGKNMWAYLFRGNMSDSASSRLGSEFIRQSQSDVTTNSGMPFFLMVGFGQSHVPHDETKFLPQAWNLIQRQGPAVVNLRDRPSCARLWSSNQFTMKRNGFCHDETGKLCGKLRTHHCINDKDRRAKAYAAYYGVDEGIGELYNTLKTESLLDNTIVVFHGDHGFSLGECSCFGKGKLLDIDTRVPLIISAPGALFKAGYGRRVTNTVVELVDVFPTLCELASVPCGPKAPSEPILDGKSLVPLLQQPHRSLDRVAISSQVLCFNPREWYCGAFPRENIQFIGTTVRSLQMRYVVWVEWRNKSRAPEFDGGKLVEALYDYPKPDPRNGTYYGLTRPMDFYITERELLGEGKTASPLMLDMVKAAWAAYDPTYSSIR